MKKITYIMLLLAAACSKEDDLVEVTSRYDKLVIVRTIDDLFVVADHVSPSGHGPWDSIDFTNYWLANPAHPADRPLVAADKLTLCDWWDMWGMSCEDNMWYSDRGSHYDSDQLTAAGIDTPYIDTIYLGPLYSDRYGVDQFAYGYSYGYPARQRDTVLIDRNKIKNKNYWESLSPREIELVALYNLAIRYNGCPHGEPWRVRTDRTASQYYMMVPPYGMAECPEVRTSRHDDYYAMYEQLSALGSAGSPMIRQYFSVDIFADAK